MKEIISHKIFCGEYETSIDENGGFILPEAFREKLSSNADNKPQFYFLFLHDALCVFSVHVLHAMVDSFINNQYQSLARAIWYLASDGQGEWSLEGKTHVPHPLLEQAGILPGSKISLVGMKNRIEIWDTKQWKKHREEMNFLLEPFVKDIWSELDSLG